jgi:hypothetical protein
LIRRLGLALALAAAIAGAAIAQTVTPPQVFTATGSDAFPTNASGLNTCSLQVSTTGSPTFTVVPQGSQDGGITYPVTVTTIGGGSISSAGNYSGSIAGATTFFRFNVATFSGTGTVTVTKTCSSQITPATQATAIAVSSLPPVVISSQPPVVVSSLPPVALAYSGASPVPVATAPPAARNSSGYTTPVQCDSITFNTGGAGLLITHSGTTTMYICSVTVGVVGSASDAIYGKYGTGSVCATGSVNLFETFVGPNAAFAWGGGLGALFTVPPGNDFCFGTAGTITNSSITVTYAQF